MVEQFNSLNRAPFAMLVDSFEKGCLLARQCLCGFFFASCSQAAVKVATVCLAGFHGGSTNPRSTDIEHACGRCVGISKAVPQTCGQALAVHDSNLQMVCGSSQRTKKGRQIICSK